MNTTERPSALQTLEQLEKLGKATITATSPQRRVKVALTGKHYNVEIRRDGFQQLDPAVLADEVIHAYTGTMRAYREAEQRAVAQYRATSQRRRPEPNQATRDLMKRLRDAIDVHVTSPGGLVKGSWSGSADIKLRITAVNESHREQLAAEIATVLTELAQKYRAALNEATVEVRRFHRSQTHVA